MGPVALRRQRREQQHQHVESNAAPQGARRFCIGSMKSSSINAHNRVRDACQQACIVVTHRWCVVIHLETATAGAARRAKRRRQSRQAAGTGIAVARRCA